MKFGFGFPICLRRKFWRLEPANQYLLPVSANSSPPFFSKRAKRNAKIPAFVSFLRPSLILNIAGCADISKVLQTVVMRNAVNMVNVIIRPFIVNVHPNDAMSTQAFVINGYKNVSIPIRTASNRTYFYSSIGPDFPNKKSSFRVVMECFSNKIASNCIHGISVT